MSFEDTPHSSHKNIFSLLRPKRRFLEFYNINALFRKYQPYLELDDNHNETPNPISDEDSNEHSNQLQFFLNLTLKRLFTKPFSRRSSTNTFSMVLNLTWHFRVTHS